jgi:hypothetical protein
MSLDGKCTEELLGLLTQYNFAEQTEKLADHEVLSVEDADCMTEEDVQEPEPDKRRLEGLREQEAEMPIMEDLLAKLSTLAQK